MPVSPMRGRGVNLGRKLCLLSVGARFCVYVCVHVHPTWRLLLKTPQSGVCVGMWRQEDNLGCHL